MVAPQAPLVKNNGAAGATKWDAAPQALLDSNCAQRNDNRQTDLAFIQVGPRTAELKPAWLSSTQSPTQHLIRDSNC